MSKKAKMIIFLKDKLISCDTILPLAMEWHSYSGSKVEFFIHTKESLEDIKKNRYLYDAISKIGSIQHFQRLDRSIVGTIKHRISILLLLSRVGVMSWLSKVNILHFGTLNNFPFNILYFLNRQNVYFCENDSFGEPPMMARVGGMGVNRRYIKFPNCKNFIAFSPYSEMLRRNEIKNVATFNFGPTRTRKSWLSYVNSRMRDDWASFCKKNGLDPGKKYFVVMLGFLGFPGTIKREPENLSEILLGEVLDTIFSIWPDTIVILKPHAITDLDALGRVLRKFEQNDVVISYMHPTALAINALAVITNIYSTTQADAKMLGVPTIEYTDYSEEALELSNNGSMNPDMIDYFINRDRRRLSTVLRKHYSEKTLPRDIMFHTEEKDNSALFSKFVR